MKDKVYFAVYVPKGTSSDVVNILRRKLSGINDGCVYYFLPSNADGWKMECLNPRIVSEFDLDEIKDNFINTLLGDHIDLYDMLSINESDFILLNNLLLLDGRYSFKYVKHESGDGKVELFAEFEDNQGTAYVAFPANDVIGMFDYMNESPDFDYIRKGRKFLYTGDYIAPSSDGEDVIMF